MYNFTCAFFFASSAIENVLIKIKKIQFKTLGFDLVIYNTFFTEYISNLKCQSINKQLANFQNYFGVLYRFCQGKGFKTFFSFQMSPWAV